ASRGREVLAERLREAGAEVDQVVVYTSRDVPHPDSDIVETLRAGRFDWVTVTSSAIARALDSLFGTALGCSRLASISPITSQTLRELGHEPAVEATEFTMKGLVDAILNDADGATPPTSAPEGPTN
ncbi:MAG: uroporphyrinogen-III synthase, partial [Thermoguttaceae bacterium]